MKEAHKTRIDMCIIRCLLEPPAFLATWAILPLLFLQLFDTYAWICFVGKKYCTSKDSIYKLQSDQTMVILSFYICALILLFYKKKVKTPYKTKDRMKTLFKKVCLRTQEESINFNGSNASTANAMGSNATGSNVSTTNATGSNASTANVMGSNATGSNASTTNATGSNTSTTNATGSNISTTNATGSNASTTNATGSNTSIINETGLNMSATGIDESNNVHGPQNKRKRTMSPETDV